MCSKRLEPVERYQEKSTMLGENVKELWGSTARSSLAPCCRSDQVVRDFHRGLRRQTHSAERGARAGAGRVGGVKVGAQQNPPPLSERPDLRCDLKTEKPTVVTVEVFVNSLGPLSTLDMEYSIDFIFYQTWYDEHLRYNDTFETLVLHGNVVSQLWILDTFFRNSKRTHEYDITIPNQMALIHKDGQVLYSVRMTIDARCSLHMLKFPMDSHSCPLSFSSFSYDEHEMIYKWENFKLQINEKNTWKIFKFDFPGVNNKTEIISTPVGDFMIMTFFFNVSRRFGFLVFQNYAPSSVTTMLSWVSFCIKTEATAARDSVALDFYIAICFVLCFCALLEFALLNFLTYNETKRQASPKLYHVRTGCWYGRQNFRMRVLCYGTWLASFPSVGKLTGVMEEINVLVWW
ncbi:gamma-aminobutyric acid (GABA) A receptor subunit epsilon [Cricetulus griseus]